MSAFIEARSEKRMNLFNSKKEKIAEITDEISPNELASLLGFDRVFIYEPEFIFETTVFTNINGKDEIAGYISFGKDI